MISNIDLTTKSADKNFGTTHNKTESKTNNARNIIQVMDLIKQNPNSPNLDLQDIIKGLKDGSLQASPSEIYYGILRKIKKESKLVLTRSDKNQMCIFFSSDQTHKQRILILENILIRAKSFENSKMEIIPDNKSPSSFQIPESKLESFEFNTRSAKRGEIKWKVNIDTGTPFILSSSEGDRTFLVVEIQNNKGEKCAQSFYKSTGQNSGNNGMWFPNQGAYNLAGNKFISKTKYTNTNAPQRLPDLSWNPSYRMGSLDSILNNGSIFLQISKLVDTVNITPKFKVEIDQVNSVLKSINPLIDLQY